MNNQEALNTLVASAGIILIIILLILLAILIPTIIAQWKLFKKAGKNGWEAIIPFYSNWVLIEISGLNWWYFLITIGISLISGSTTGIISFILNLISIYINFNIYYNIAKKTKQNEILYGIMGIFVPYIAIMILGFNKNISYDNNVQVSPNGVI